MPRYLYGMRHQRGFGPGCQPSRGLIGREDDPAGRYIDVLVYDRELELYELDAFELDFMGVEPDAGDLISRFDDTPLIQPDTTTHESNVVKKGGNDEDRTSGDCISRTQAIDTIKKRLFETAFNNIGVKQNVDETLVDVAEDRLETWFDDVPPAQPDVIRCKDCINYIDDRCVVADHHVAPFSCCQDVFNARRSEMSGGITVKEFKHIPGVNDAEYIKRLEELHEIDKGIISKAVAKIKMLSAQPERKGHGCEYCCEDSDGYVLSIEKNGHAYIQNGKLALRANGWWGECGIEYCPMCGRKLRGEQ